jgi:hypothetical protein
VYLKTGKGDEMCEGVAWWPHLGPTLVYGNFEARFGFRVRGRNSRPTDDRRRYEHLGSPRLLDFGLPLESGSRGFLLNFPVKKNESPTIAAMSRRGWGSGRLSRSSRGQPPL